MGVPALFRWLSQKYPKITVPVVEDLPDLDDDGNELAVDWTTPNPNNWELDNLYLDMNGIIHPCCHPEDKPAPETEDAMFVEIFNYIDRLMAMVRPRKLVYMAIDGVAPRAKMNQQRSRRFRAAQEAQDKADDEQRARDEWEADHDPLPEKLDSSSSAHRFDSNCITPGTPFMANLAVCLRYYITDRIQHHPAWRNLKVILSDASAPGEGEHKIMDFVRRQRCQPSYDPQTSHCLYGLDADLIMLALATHEPHFRILREDVFAKDAEGKGKCFICGQQGHQAAQCTGKPKEQPDKADPHKPIDAPSRKPFIFLKVPVLREYLEAELRFPDAVNFKWNLERAIDDWVFLVFFVGNDFLPHLPSLEIREGAIDTLIELWKKTVPRLGAYLTESGEVNLEGVGEVLVELGKHEDGIFRERRKKEEQKKEAAKRREKEAEERRRRTQGGYDNNRQNGGAHFRFGQDGVPEVVKAHGPQAEGIASVKPIDKKPKTASQLASERLAAERDAAELAVAVPRRDPRALGLPGQSTSTPVTAAERSKANMAAAAALREKLFKKKDGGVVEVATPELAGKVGEENKEGEVVKKEKEDEVKKEEEEVNMEVDEPEQEEPRGQKRKADEGDGDDATTGLGIVTAESTLPDSIPATEIKLESAKEESEDPDQLSEEEIEAELAEDEEEEALQVEDSLTVADVPIPHKPVRRESLKGGEEEEPFDDVRLWEDGWKGRYYKNKFGVDEADAAFKAELVKAYVEGFSWVLKYYYQGVQSWKWFYPYHYSPFASDFVNLGQLLINFDLGTPFKPIEQLMGVLPAASRAHIPEPFHPLMLDPESEIIDFYPEKFQIDLNGKKYAWQGVALLPFIDEKRLLEAIEPRYELISEEERDRNERGPELIFVGPESSVYDVACSVYGEEGAGRTSVGEAPGDTFGTLAADSHVCAPGSTFVSPLKSQDLPDLHGTETLSAVFEHPAVPAGHIFKAELLPTVKMPERELTADDVHWIRMGRPGRGGRLDRGAASRFGQIRREEQRGDRANSWNDRGRDGGGWDRDNRNRDRSRDRDRGNSWSNDDSRRDGGGYQSYGNRSQSFSGGGQTGGGGWRPSGSYGQQQQGGYGSGGSWGSSSYSPSRGGGGDYQQGGGGGGRITAYGTGGTITAYGASRPQNYAQQPQQQQTGGYGYGTSSYGLNPSAQSFTPGAQGGYSASSYGQQAGSYYGQQQSYGTQYGAAQQQGYGQQQAYGGQQQAYGYQQQAYPPTQTQSAPAAYPGYGTGPPPPLQAQRPPANLAWSRNLANTGSGTYGGSGGYRPSNSR